MAKRPFYRNPVAQSPLLRKGGVHQVSKSGQRAQARTSLSNALDEWMEEVELVKAEKEGELCSPSFCMQFFQVFKPVLY